MTLFPQAPGAFGLAEEPWMPRLCDILHKRDVEKDLRYQKVGLEKCYFKMIDYPYMTSEWDAICELFNERYMLRMLGQETLERWQMRLQYRLDQILPQYERAFELYEKNSEEIDNVKQTQTTSSSGKVKAIDTPDSKINDSDGYADRVTKNEGEVTVTMEPEGGLLESVHKNVDEWRNLEDRFVSEFENLFLNTFDY